jgi:predicted MPP superfamily phosphohydrolase
MAERTIVSPVSPRTSRASESPPKSPKRTRRWVVRGLVALIASAGLYAFFVEPDWVEVTRPTLAPGAPVRDVLPVRSAAGALRVLHLSDLHGNIPGPREAAVLATIEREKPDLVVLTGDTCDTGRFGPYASFLAALHAPLGVFAVEGNWEHWRPAEDEVATYRSAGITLLVNESRKLRDDLWIVGFDDQTGGRPDAVKALRDVPASVTTLALMHSPGFFDSIAGRVTFALAGHTHGGQVCAPGLGPLWLPQGCGRYVAGVYEERGSTMYVSRGLGTSMLPVRFFSRPEIALVTLAIPGTR